MPQSTTPFSSAGTTSPKGKVTAEARDKTLANLSGTTKIEDFKDCDIVIEAIVENIDEKAKTFAAVEAVVGGHTILCSNTSSLCITELAAKNGHDLIALGTHGYRGVRRFLLGSVAEAVVRHAHCSVLVTHPDKRGGG